MAEKTSYKPVAPFEATTRESVDGSEDTLLRGSADEINSARWQEESRSHGRRGAGGRSHRCQSWNGRLGMAAAVTTRLLALTLALICVGSFVYMARTMQGISTSIATSLDKASVVSYGDCGQNDSVEEARAKGCVFDPMGWIWTRPECYDAELVEDFMNRTEWSWHTDPKLTAESQVPLEVIFRGDHPKLFTSKKYHYVHCTYMWKKMHKALMNHHPIDSYLTDYTHTHHCEMVLLNDFLHEDVQCTAEMVCPTWVRATWTSCSTM